MSVEFIPTEKILSALAVILINQNNGKLIITHEELVEASEKTILVCNNLSNGIKIFTISN